MLMPNTVASNIESAIKKWRGIIFPQSCLLNHGTAASWAANGGNSIGHGSGNKLLIIGSRESRDVGSGWRDFDRNGGGDNIIQRTKRGGKRSDVISSLFKASATLDAATRLIESRRPERSARSGRDRDHRQ